MNSTGTSFECTPLGIKTKINLCGSSKSMILDHSWSNINQAWYNWQQNGDLVQNAFAFLSPGEREFIVTGLSPEEWAETFKDEEGE
jgi:hypothetical protein